MRVRKFSYHDGPRSDELRGAQTAATLLWTLKSFVKLHVELRCGRSTDVGRESLGRRCLLVDVRMAALLIAEIKAI